MDLFRRHKRITQKVGGEEVTVDKKIAAAVKEAMASPAPTRRRRRWFVDARRELQRINDEERRLK